MKQSMFETASIRTKEYVKYIINPLIFTIFKDAMWHLIFSTSISTFSENSLFVSISLKETDIKVLVLKVSKFLFKT